MSENNRNRKPKRKYNPVLEWISDRLRYIELIAAIVVVILVLVFLVRGILKRNEKPQNATGQAVQSVSSTASGVDSSSENNSVTPAVSSGSASVSSSSSGTDTLKKDSGDVNAAVQTYFGELISSGNSGAIESYSNITTYSYPGPSEGTYIAFVEYTYKYKDYSDTIPGLSEFYVAPDDSGKLVISDDSSEEIQKAMSDAASTESAKALIADVQSKYDAVVNANEDLKNYISTLGSSASDSSSDAGTASADDSSGNNDNGTDSTGDAGTTDETAGGTADTAADTAADAQ